MSPTNGFAYGADSSTRAPLRWARTVVRPARRSSRATRHTRDSGTVSRATKTTPAMTAMPVNTIVTTSARSPTTATAVRVAAMPAIQRRLVKTSMRPRCRSSAASEIVASETGRSAPMPSPISSAAARIAADDPAAASRPAATAIIAIVIRKTGRRPKRSPRRPPSTAPIAMPRVRHPEAIPTSSAVSAPLRWKATTLLLNPAIAAASRYEAIPHTTATHHAFVLTVLRPMCTPTCSAVILAGAGAARTIDDGLLET